MADEPAKLYFSPATAEQLRLLGLWREDEYEVTERLPEGEGDG